ncbi:MAG: DUF1203 domain-containing protein [Arenibacterium sp.]
MKSETNMITYQALPTEAVRALQSGGRDAYGNLPERAVSEGGATPCRHCLRNIPEGEAMLILAHRPFDGLHPYAETGPIFLCADTCAQGGGDDATPEALSSPEYLVKGYSAADRIVYGTGDIVPTEAIAQRAADLLEQVEVEYVHVRSARNNCYIARIDASA